MKIDRLKLLQFRNYNELDFMPEKGINVLLGENAQGKTNILEAISLCATARSHRTNRDSQMIMHGADAAYIGLDIHKKGVTNKIEIRLQKSLKKQIKVDRNPIYKISDLMGRFSVVFFSPEDLNLIKSGPGERRRFIDVDLSQFRSGYFSVLQAYTKALSQKNALLKQLQMGRANIQLLDAWDELLVKHGAVLMDKRQSFIEELFPISRRIHLDLSQNREELVLEYSPSVAFDSVSNIENLLAQNMKALRDDDIKRGICQKGPHRDDIAITINGSDARFYASQGQQRSIALSMRCSELFMSDSSTKPVLLLDDVMSELDENRQGFLLEIAQMQQTIITCTSFAHEIPSSIFEVKDKKVTRTA